VRTIVVGVDSSERSLDALALARRLADRGTGTVLVCAYGADPILATDGGSAYGRAVRADAEATLARFGGGIGNASVAVADHHPAHALQRIARERDASLIVVGSSHKGALNRLLPGSTGERVLRGAPCPVAIAPRGYCDWPDDGPRTVACAYGTEADSLAALPYAARLARGLGARLRVVRVGDPPGPVDALLALDDVGAAAARRLRRQPVDELDRTVAELDLDLEAEALLLYGGTAAELVRTSFAVDFLVLGSRGYGPLRGALAGSVSGKVLRSAACPVIVVPPSARVPVEESPVRVAARRRRMASGSAAVRP
jgi:nucleotide-binding universal stress UspA family protein